MEKDSNSYYEERPKKVLDDNRVEEADKISLRIGGDSF